MYIIYTPLQVSLGNYGAIRGVDHIVNPAETHEEAAQNLRDRFHHYDDKVLLVQEVTDNSLGDLVGIEFKTQRVPTTTYTDKVVAVRAAS